MDRQRSADGALKLVKVRFFPQTKNDCESIFRIIQSYSRLTSRRWECDDQFSSPR